MRCTLVAAIMCPTNSLCGAPLHDNNAPRATAPRPALRVHALHLRMKAGLLRDLGSAGCSCVTASPEGPTPQLRCEHPWQSSWRSSTASEAAARSTATIAAQRISELEKERDNLRASHARLRQELELWKRRLCVAKAERADHEKQLALEFAEKMRQLDELAGTLGIGESKPDEDDEPARDGKLKGERARGRGTGRRNLRALPLEEERVELPDPHLEKLVEDGKIMRDGFEESAKLLYKRGGKRALSSPVCVTKQSTLMAKRM